MFDDFRAYCRQLNYACGRWDWPYRIDPFEGMDPEWLATYEDEVYPTYEAQGIDLNTIVQQKLNNPLDMTGLKNTVVMVWFSTSKGNPVYNNFLKEMYLSGTNPSNYEVYYLVKMIEQNQPAFKIAIDRCGEWCYGSWGKIR
jgi:hypothetical protein